MAIRNLYKYHYLNTCRDGAAVIEFAIVAPVLFLFLIGILELGLVFFTYSVLEGATSVGARTGKTGFALEGYTREQYIREQVINLSGGFLDSRRLNISILSYDNFGEIGQPEPCIDPPTPPCPGVPGVNFIDINGNGTWDEDRGKFGPGLQSEVVVYKVSYPWDIFTPLISVIVSGGDSDGVVDISAIATIRNERFQSDGD